MQRLKTRPQFQAVLAGTQVAKTGHFVLHRHEINPAMSAPFPTNDIWIGAMVPKRWAKRAVTRNAIKRQVYTVSASLTDQFPQAAFLVRLRRGFSRETFVSATSIELKEAVRSELLALMRAGLASKLAT